MSCRLMFAAMFVAACQLAPPPAIDPQTQSKAPTQPPLVEQPKTADADPKTTTEPAPQGDDSAKLEMMMADPECVVEVVAVLKSARGLWSDTKKNTCTYEVVVNGQRYKYTRQLPRDRKSEPEAVCERGLDTTDSAVRNATHECKDLASGQRPVTGLIPIR